MKKQKPHDPIDIATGKRKFTDCSIESQSKLIDLWLTESDEMNVPRKILEAFKIGIEEGRKQST